MNKDPRAQRGLNDTFNIASGVFVPLGTVENRLGVLFALDPEVKDYDPLDVRRLEQIAALATAALERARLHEEVHERAEELALLNEIGAVLVESRQIETSLNRIAEIVRLHFQAQGLVIMLPGFDLHLTATAWAGPLSSRLMQIRCPLSESGFPQAVLESDQPIYISDTGDEPKLSSSFATLGPEAFSIIMAPMLAARGTTGVLCMVQPKGHLYSNSDIRRLQAAARLSGSAVERGELGQALQASEARLRDILDGLPALVAGLDRGGHLVSLNAYAEKVLGYNEADVLGRHVFELLINDPHERARLVDAFQNLIAMGGRVKDKQATLMTSQNRPLKVIVSTEPLMGPDGQLNGLVVMATDITEKFQLEAQLLQAQKMESVGALAGGMAHDFNNLLAGILGQSALAKAMLNGTDPLYETISKIEGAANRGADLTRKLLTFARKSVMQIKPIDLAALVRETSELLAGSLPRKIRIDQVIMPDTPRVLGDTTQLQQVFLNLCVNARDAMPNGGVLSLRLEKAESGEARIEIRDTGTGMSPEVKAHLFEPFFTTKEVGRGTGLGLAVVFGIIKSHSGRIEVESELGKGTAFIVHLPPESKRAVRPTPPTLPSIPKKPQAAL
jgi:PAS domain S-box-containing protein